jgi:hypothetical protein
MKDDEVGVITTESILWLINNWRLARREARLRKNNEVVSMCHDLAGAIMLSLNFQLERDLEEGSFKKDVIESNDLRKIFILEILDFQITLRVQDALRFEEGEEIEDEDVSYGVITGWEEEVVGFRMWRSRYVHINVKSPDRSFFDGRLNCEIEEEGDDIELGFRSMGVEASLRLLIFCKHVLDAEKL